MTKEDVLIEIILTYCTFLLVNEGKNYPNLTDKNLGVLLGDVLVYHHYISDIFQLVCEPINNVYPTQINKPLSSNTIKWL